MNEPRDEYEACGVFFFLGWLERKQICIQVVGTLILLSTTSLTLFKRSFFSEKNEMQMTSRPDS